MQNKKFIWGVATSSYQIEGANQEGGRGESIWDAFCKEPHKIYLGQDGSKACDHYHHYKEDIRLIAELGVKAYRFSISWPRILPNGIGEINQKGIDFYKTLVDELLKYGIEPYVTLFHWDYPYALEMQGGWLNPESSNWFEYYTEKVVEMLGDKVTHYITLNEPQIFTWQGYKTCIHAPGIPYSNRRLLQMVYNIALAHGKAVLKIREKVRQSKVGYAPTCGSGYFPQILTKENIALAERMNKEVTEDSWLQSAALWNELLLRGRYPIGSENILSEDLPKIKEADRKIICQPLDFCGMNIYHGLPVRVNDKGEHVVGAFDIGTPKTGMNWPVVPECLYWLTKFFYKEYQLPLIITENGMSALDAVSLDGKVHDWSRINYIERHLIEMEKAIQEGVDIRGYFYWSFMDNFEWEKGYNDRFGLVYIDYLNQARIPKDSYYWYKEKVNKK